jgi:hypothetical protein
MAIPEAIVAAVGAAGDITDGIRKVGNALDGDRTVVLIVENTSAHALERISTSHDHGGFAVTPSAIIPAKSVAIFGSQDKGFMTGTEGQVKYRVKDKRDDNTVMTITWKNPFAGKNAASASVRDNGNASKYLRTLAVAGAGDKEAEMRYTLLKR